MSVLGVVATSVTLPRQSVRASRIADLLRVIGVAEYDVWRHPDLVAAAVALVHKVERLVLASTPEDLGDVDARVVLDTPAGAFAGEATWPWLDGTPTFVALVDLAGSRAAVAREDLGKSPDLPAPPDPIAPSWRRRGLYVVPGRAEALIPHYPSRLPVTAAVLAATLYLTGRPTLLPTIDYKAPVLPLDDLAELGYCPLGLQGPARGVTRGPGFPQRSRPPLDVSESPIPPDLESQLWPLHLALTALCQRSAHRLSPGPAGAKSIEREAKKLLQAEVAAGRIKGYALAVTPEGDDLQDLGLEVVVTLPRRVGQVVLRFSQTPRP